MVNEYILNEFNTYRKDYGKNLIFVEANPQNPENPQDPQKCFNFSFYLYIPPVASKDMKTSMIMECLNNYEKELPEGITENRQAVREIYSKFSENNIVIEPSTKNPNGKNEEDYSSSLERMVDRMGKAFGPINRASHIEGFPAIVPIIPGFRGSNVEKLNQVKSQLDKDIIQEVAPQIKAMYECASKIIEERTRS